MYIQLSLKFSFIQSNIEHGVTVVLDYINNHYEEIIALNGYSIKSFQADVSKLAKKFKNKVQRDKLKTFIDANKESLKGALDQILVDVDNNLKIIDNELHKFKEFFRKDETKNLLL
ncbi:hypothetical protein PV327_001735 [Microctonus hyperodae]|uniref:Uncharacterized protein n=1 Tax=Microctonus hyperodae TaxID=165561 RepID=A0AA39FE36_MICHY|nr:hypothetical protein PV327_001735 [Microctonus hyperodae]